MNKEDKNSKKVMRELANAIHQDDGSVTIPATKKGQPTKKYDRFTVAAIKARHAARIKNGQYPYRSCDIYDRKIMRNFLRSQYGNRAIRKIWVDMRIRKLGIVSYVQTLKATDPKRRRASHRYPDIPEGSYRREREKYATR